MRGCLLRWKPVEVPSTWERPPLGFPQKFTCPRMSVGYAGVLPIRGQAPAYRTMLLGICPVPNPNRRLSSDPASFQDVRERAGIWSGTYSSLKLPQKLKKL